MTWANSILNFKGTSPAADREVPTTRAPEPGWPVNIWVRGDCWYKDITAGWGRCRA